MRKGFKAIGPSLELGGYLGFEKLFDRIGNIGPPAADAVERPVIAAPINDSGVWWGDFAERGALVDRNA
ncbi:MAG: hypothetical protein IPK63_16280 [Candidatus Competibacteraceae bacterium]|nr:hypothetical protein [Candidatus Competibacteraceae bacterium]